MAALDLIDQPLFIKTAILRTSLFLISLVNTPLYLVYEVQRRRQFVLRQSASQPVASFWCFKATVKSFWDVCVYYLFRSWASPLTPAPRCVHPHVSERRGGNSKLSILSIYSLYQVGRFLSTWHCRAQSGGNNTFECSAERATIAWVCKQCGPGSGSGHRTQLPSLSAPAPARRSQTSPLAHMSLSWIHPHTVSLCVFHQQQRAAGLTCRRIWFRLKWTNLWRGSVDHQDRKHNKWNVSVPAAAHNESLRAT